MNPHHVSSRTVPVILIFALAVSAFPAPADVLPPQRMNYQGVLRDQNGVPLSGTYDMWFRFFDAADSAGNEILVDQHAAATGNAVTVSGGLLDVVLGTGTITDGSGPGAYGTLSAVFRDYTDVWLEIQVGAETLSPRTQIQTVPYAFNAYRLAGQAASYFINGSSTGQQKNGQLQIYDLSGQNPGALFAFDGKPGGIGLVASGATGVNGTTTAANNGIGGDFEAHGNGGIGVSGYGSPSDPNTTGVFGWGGLYGGDFKADIAVNAFGNSMGGKFRNTGPTGYAELASGTTGVWAEGSTTGGHFKHRSGVSVVDLGMDTTAVTALGRYTGGLFQNAVTGGVATLAEDGVGIKATGPNVAGIFTISSSEAKLADGNYGIQAKGPSGGGTFTNTLNAATATLASNGRGITASGPSLAGYFSNSTPGVEARLADGWRGITLVGANTDVAIFAGAPSYGSYFYNGSPDFSYAYIPYLDRGVRAFGSVVGGDFHNFNSGSYAYVGYSSYKIFGSGAVSFVQNHPADASKAIVYAAPEGDEVAVYTRGSGRLVNGEARVKLGETFELVANPDIGLTATVTPTGDAIPLGVVEKNTRELVVRGPAGSNASFDYIVYGLRIGFEEQSIVQPRQEDSKIPSMHQHEAWMQADPSLRRHTALARFEEIEQKVNGKVQADYSRAQSLRDAIGVAPFTTPTGPHDDPSNPVGRPAAPSSVRATGPGDSAPAESALDEVSQQDMHRTAERLDRQAGQPGEAPSSPPLTQPGLDFFQAGSALETGDVVSLSTEVSGAVIRSDGPNDSLVIGCVQMSDEGLGRAGVATTRIAVCRVSASYGSISVGDRLSPSPIAGTAMKADAAMAGSVILGRAIEPLESGTGLVRVLLGAK